MLRRLKLAFDAGTDLLELKAQIILRSLEQVGVVLIGYVAAGVLLALGAGTMLAAATVLLAAEIGAGLALLSVGGSVALVGAIILGVFYARSDSRTHKSRDELEQEVTIKEEQLHVAFHGEPKPEPEEEVRTPEVPHAILNAVTKDPAMIATACFAAVSFLGLKRSMRLLAAATAAARFVQSVHGKLNSNRHHADAASHTAADERSRVPPVPPLSRRSARSSRAGDGQWNERHVGTSPRR
jgi:hypothetical protein